MPRHHWISWLGRTALPAEASLPTGAPSLLLPGHRNMNTLKPKKYLLIFKWPDLYTEYTEIQDLFFKINYTFCEWGLKKARIVASYLHTPNQSGGWNSWVQTANQQSLVHISKYTVEDTTAVSGNEIRGQWVLCKAVRWYGYGCKEYRGGADEVRGC